MKYIVEVNAKWMVSVEADTALQAEHKVLEYDGIWGALAFDRAALKTDTFAGAVQGCEMISFSELVLMTEDAAAATKAVGEAMKEQDAAQKEVDALNAELEAAIAKLKEATQSVSVAKWVMNNEYEKLGRERR